MRLFKRKGRNHAPIQITTVERYVVGQPIIDSGKVFYPVIYKKSYHHNVIVLVSPMCYEGETKIIRYFEDYDSACKWANEQECYIGGE